MTYSHLEARAILTSQDPGGIELLVIGGSVRESGVTIEKNGWLRLPEGETLSLTAGPEGAKIWMKTGHLPSAAAPKV
ncbi:hypothetical protein [Breoghania sp. L-A4]|uniref:hypothetical protein n=1 Tax=Breoghania sp. L-A4 TaxID=2304600 RepID=UPI0020BFC08F|nr:hypothetical protein [Breoghania sp. L-A4]